MNHTLSCSRVATLTVAAVLIQLVGLSLFIFGFFPIKPALSGIRSFPTDPPPYCVHVRPANYLGSVALTLTKLERELHFLVSVFSGPESFRAPWDDAAENQSTIDLSPDQLRRLYQVGFLCLCSPPVVSSSWV